MPSIIAVKCFKECLGDGCGFEEPLESVECKDFCLKYISFNKLGNLTIRDCGYYGTRLYLGCHFFGTEFKCICNTDFCNSSSRFAPNFVLAGILPWIVYFGWI
uniref:Uncharacterized protein n=1 Tax=Panagrolaimus sp. JU765 TaxID=591449 RepID=A0AC34QN41_9BILA